MSTGVCVKSENDIQSDIERDKMKWNEISNDKK